MKKDLNCSLHQITSFRFDHLAGLSRIRLCVEEPEKSHQVYIHTFFTLIKAFYFILYYYLIINYYE